jgi:toxin ParE1/3/4
VKQYRVVLDPEAIADLNAIRDHIAEKAGKPVASKVTERVLNHMQSFEMAPKRGVARDDLRPGLRTVGWRRAFRFIFFVDDVAAKVVFFGRAASRP